MAAFSSGFTCTLLILLLVFTITCSSKLNVPHVLLPIFKDVNVKFQLETVNGGCYKWSTTRMELINLEMVDPSPHLHCSSKAVVSSISTDPVRNTAVVLAEDEQTQQILRVDVIVDVIDTLSIVTTTKEIIMQEIPEMYRVVAYDNQGNQFTSLQGVEFDWKIISMGQNKDVTVFRFISFKESPYDTPDSIEEFEGNDKMGDVVLLEGVKTGSAKLQVKLPYEEYSHLELCEVQVAVVANLVMLPSDVYILPYDVIEYKLYAINNGKMESVDIPNSQYYLTSDDIDVAAVESKTGEVTGVKEGKTRISLRDRFSEENDSTIKLPTAFIHVCMPAYITLTLLPHSNWAILINTHHTLLAEIYSSGDHKLNVGQGIELQVIIDERFQVEERAANGTWVIGYGKEQGRAPVTVILEGVVNKRLGRTEIGPLVKKEEIQIYPSIILTPDVVVLPWDPVMKPRYEIPLKATGGDGNFVWTSDDPSVGIVMQNGVVKTNSDGEFEVSAIMHKNHNNNDTAKFLVVPPIKLEIIEYITEAEVNQNIFIHVALYAEKPEPSGSKTQIPFSQCQELPLKIEITNSDFVINRNSSMDPIGVACASFAIIGSVVGTTKVTVSYNTDGKYLDDTITLIAYDPLAIIYPSLPIVLAVGTTTQLVFTGGPMAVQGRSNLYEKNVTTFNDGILEAFDLTEKSELPPSEENYIVVEVLCRKLGETSVTLSVFSTSPISRQQNPSCEKLVEIICGKPRTLALQPEIKVTNPESCPLDLSADKIIVQSSQEIELDIIVADQKGLRFLNISSLLFEWVIDPPDAAEVQVKDGMIPRDIIQGSLNFGNKSYQVVTPKAENGTIIITARVIGYRKKLLDRFKITPEWPEFRDETEQGIELPAITTTISVLLVDNTEVFPKDITIYNHPADKKSVEVKFGSGYYEIQLSTPDIADVVYSSSNRQIDITPRKSGELTIELVDLCLVAQPPRITVHVVSVSIIKVEMSDKVEVGKSIACTVKLYDDSDNLLAVPSLDMISLRISQEPDIVKIDRLTPSETEPWPGGHIKFVVFGDQTGNTKLTFSILNSVVPVESLPLDLQVFAPMKIIPRNTTLLLGTSVQYTHEGGPEPSPTIEYSIENAKLGDISSNGVLSALSLGTTTVLAKSYGTNTATGQKVIYSTDTVDVNIISLQGVNIKAPLTRFRLNEEVPVWVIGIPDEISPMILGSAKPDYIYNWTVEDPDIMQMVGAFEKLGVFYDVADQISIRVKGLRPGKTKLMLSVTIPGNIVKKKKSVTFTDSLEFEVFEGLRLMSPARFSGKRLLMAPYASIQLMTNMDSSSSISYKLVGDDQSTVTVSKEGMLKSLGQLGYATILIIATDQFDLQQTLSIIVEVKPIYYMKLNVIADWTMGNGASNNVLPLGTELQLKATYHDNTGNEFSAATAILKTRTSRLDLIRIKLGIDNTTLLVSLSKPGITILKAWADGLPLAVEYMKFHVGQVIVPKITQLVTGDVVCVWTPIRGVTPGIWSSSDYKLFDIDEVTGVGVARPSKGGRAYLKHNLHPVAPIQLDILPISNLIFMPECCCLKVSNSAEGKPLEVPVLVAGENTNRKNNLIHAKQCNIDITAIVKDIPFDCELSFANITVPFDIHGIFQVQGTFNPRTGMYACTITSTGLVDQSLSIMESKVVLVAKSKSNNVVSEQLPIDFMPAIFIDKELVLDEYHFSADLVIVSTPAVLAELKVTPFDPNLLDVSSPIKVNKHTVRYMVKLVDYHWKLNEYDGPLIVRVISPLTEENIKVTVKVLSPGKFNGQEFASRGQSPLGSFLYNQRYLLIIIISMLVMFFGTFYAYSQFIQPSTVQVNVTPVGPSYQSSMQRPRCPCTNPHCTQRISPFANRSGAGPSSNVTPETTVYGDPSSFYNTSPELRRNRRFM